MSVRYLYDPDEDVAVMYDSVTETAFGPLVRASDSYEQTEDLPIVSPMAMIEGFVASLSRDARTYRDDALNELFASYLNWRGLKYDPDAA